MYMSGAHCFNPWLTCTCVQCARKSSHIHCLSSFRIIPSCTCSKCDYTSMVRTCNAHCHSFSLPATVGRDNESAEDYFKRIQEETSTLILWPSRLKIGAKSKKGTVTAHSLICGNDLGTHNCTYMWCGLPAHAKLCGYTQ